MTCLLGLAEGCNHQLIVSSDMQLIISTDMQETRVGLAGRADGRDSQDWPASIVATDPSHDLAVLRIEAPREALQPVRLGTSNDLKVGQSLYAIGFPYGLSRTLTAGVVSGLNREIPNPAGSKTQGAIQVKLPASPLMSFKLEPFQELKRLISFGTCIQALDWIWRA